MSYSIAIVARRLHLDEHLSLTDHARDQILQLVQSKRAQESNDLRLPSEAELCATLGVSRITVRRAMDQLVAAGDIVRHHGRGTFAVMSTSRPTTSTGAVVGLLYGTDQINDYTGKIIAALDRAARRRGMTTAICTELGDLDTWQPGAGLPSLQGPVRGYISNAIPLDQLARLEARRIPTVCLNNIRFLGRARYIIYEGPQNFSLPGERLLALGHEHLAYVGPDTADQYLEKELQPFRLLLKTKYPSASLSLVNCGGEWSDVVATTKEIAQSQPALTGLLVYDDLIAAWLIAALQKLGKRVPEDISVIAYNAFTDTRASLAVDPQISCMELRYNEIANQAVDLFARILDGTAPPRKRVVTVRKLIERGSTATASRPTVPA